MDMGSPCAHATRTIGLVRCFPGMLRVPVVLSSLVFIGCAQRPMSPGALDPLVGEWQGELAYMDYGSGSEYRIPVNMHVRAGAEHTWDVRFIYPDEPDASDSSTWVLSADGRTFDGLQVLHVRQDTEGLDLRLEGDGEDDNSRARIRKHWTITADSCVMRKEVSAADVEDFRLRHTYRFRRFRDLVTEKH